MLFLNDFKNKFYKETPSVLHFKYQNEYFTVSLSYMKFKQETDFLDTPNNLLPIVQYMVASSSDFNASKVAYFNVYINDLDKNCFIIKTLKIQVLKEEKVADTALYTDLFSLNESVKATSINFRFLKTYDFYKSNK